jgi:hypothetical protein
VEVTQNRSDKGENGKKKTKIDDEQPDRMPTKASIDDLSVL